MSFMYLSKVDDIPNLIIIMTSSGFFNVALYKGTTSTSSELEFCIFTFLQFDIPSRTNIVMGHARMSP